MTLSKLFGAAEVALTLGHAAAHARFGHGDLASILDDHAATTTSETHRAGEDGSLTQGTDLENSRRGEGRHVRAALANVSSKRAYRL